MGFLPVSAALYALRDFPKEPEIKRRKYIMYATIWALLPPVIAIALALITKEVYSSLFIGILVGGILFAVPGSGSIGAAFEGTMVHVFEDGIVGVLSDGYNVGILIFLVILGAMVCLMNKAGGSAAFEMCIRDRNKSRAPGHPHG